MTLYYVQRAIRLEHMRGGASHFKVGQYVDSAVDLGPGDEQSPQFHDHVRQVPEGMSQEDFDKLLQEEAAAEGAPKNVDVPYASLAGAIVNCTMGNWTNEPTTYAYQWQRDGVDIAGSTAADHTIVVADDEGHSLACVVTATNAVGSGVAPASNAVPIGEPASAGTEAAEEDEEEVEVEEEDPHTGARRTTTQKKKRGRRY